MTKKRENVRLIEEVKGYPAKHEDAKDDGYDEAAQQNPHVVTPGFVHKTWTHFIDSMYDYQADGRCACGSTFTVQNEAPGWSRMTRVVAFMTKENGPCPALWPAIERADARVKVALERPKLCGMCCGATTRADGKTTGWGHFEGKICPVCKGVGTKPVRDSLNPRFSGWTDDQLDEGIENAVARLRAHGTTADSVMRIKDPSNYRMRNTTTWWLKEILEFVRDKMWEAEVEQVRAEAEVKE